MRSDSALTELTGDQGASARFVRWSCPRRVVLAIAVGLLLVGTGLRFWQLDRMFAHIDDLFPIAGPYVMNQGAPKHVTVPYTDGRVALTVDSSGIKHNPFLYAAYVSTATYAPLQFLTYPLVLSGDYSYREFLFRGRLPSAIFGSLVLAVFLWTYLAYVPALDLPAMLGLAVLSFSLLNITYSQQSISYAIGVLGAVVLIGLLGRMAATPTTLRGLLGWAAVCAAITWANYQLGVLTGLAYSALALTELRRDGVAGFFALCRRYAVSVAVFALLVLPLAIPLHDKSSGVGQFKGLVGARQFFPPSTGDGVVEPAARAARYAASAAYRLVETDVLFALESPWAAACVSVLFVLVLAGAWSVMRRRDASGRALAVFALCLTLLLGVLNGFGQFPISPTRHVLVFSPLIALLMSLGARAFRPIAIRDWCVSGLLIGVMALFAVNYPAFRAARTDPFDEQRFAALLDQHRIDTIVGYGSTWQPALMFRTGSRHITFIDLDAIVRKQQDSLIQLPETPFLLVSQTLPIDQYSSRYPLVGSPLTFPNHRVRELSRIESHTEIGISNAVKLGGNGLYLSIAVPRCAGGEGNEALTCAQF